MSSICDVPGIKVGHAQNDLARTGCTVILPENDATAGVDVRGSAPGTREIELLKPVRLVQKIHAILLTGGSAFGLNAAGGVQKFLEEKNIGYDTGIIKVPIVPCAVLFDLGVGDPRVRPDEAMGYAACLNANVQETRQGRIGAGCGATAGKLKGMAFASDSGIGTCSYTLGNIVTGVITAANPLGDIINPETGEILAGIKSGTGGFINSLELMKQTGLMSANTSNTTLSVVATNAAFNREECTKIAQMAHDGMARAIRPCHTMYDGDIIFVLSTGEKKCDVTLVGAIAAELVEKSIVNAVLTCINKVK